MRGLLGLVLLLVLSIPACATKLLIPMDGSQQNHLKAYGIAFWTLGREASIDWLLNYRGGSFLIDHYTKWKRNARSGVSPSRSSPMDKRMPFSLRSEIQR